jgi:hypothetical protein
MLPFAAFINKGFKFTFMVQNLYIYSLTLTPNQILV